MMIVVPPLTQRDQRDKPVIAAVVTGRKAALAEDMRQRVNRESAVIKDHRADEETPNQHLPSRRAKTWGIPREDRPEQKHCNRQ